MTKASELGAIWSGYMSAVSAYSDASSVLHNHVLTESKATAREIQRADDARVIMIGARTAYLDAKQGQVAF
jgi:hypothetical protein